MTLHPLFFLTTLLPFLVVSQPEVNQERLQSTITELSTFGKDASGNPNRVAFSDGDIEARNYVIKLMEEAGLEVGIDFAGNIRGRRAGKSASKKPITFGSHIDMVPQGGNYDGCVGSMGAIEVVMTLQEKKLITEHPLEVLIFSNEEGGLLGSRAVSGVLGKEALQVVNSTGFTMEEGLKRIGGNPDKIGEVALNSGNIAAFLELHIEQGGILEKETVAIGIVEGIVGIKWWDVEITGFANHAGTTPMDARQDALLAAAKFIVAVNEVITGVEGKQVGTVGRINASPGAPNVIPGTVKLSLEIRDLSSEKIEMLYAAIQIAAEKIALTSNTQIHFTPVDANSKPALTDPGIQASIAEAATNLGLSFKKMQSGAGHDAQDMALITPSGMIFVPSKGGISHSPKEYTSPEDMANGANVLLQTILILDKTLK